MNKLLNEIMNIEFLIQYLLICGIGINIVVICVILSKIIHVIAGL